jgi:hypothetical protein
MMLRALPTKMPGPLPGDGLCNDPKYLIPNRLRQFLFESASQFVEYSRVDPGPVRGISDAKALCSTAQAF